jgi:hypothetical protein
MHVFEEAEPMFQGSPRVSGGLKFAERTICFRARAQPPRILDPDPTGPYRRFVQ